MTHEQITLVVLGGFLLQILGLVELGRLLREAKRESRQGARVLGALIVQEPEKIQSLLRDDRLS